MAALTRWASDQASVLAFRVGWLAIRRMPERAAYALFDQIADRAVRRGAARQLRANYATVRPELSESELDTLVREGMRSYLRYYCEAFRLPVMSPEDITSRLRLVNEQEALRELAEGRSCIGFLGHLGNWDLAGAWAAINLAPIVTVAERLKPEAIFRAFLDFRNGLGLTIYPLTGGQAPFPALRRAAREHTLIPLLADRDLTQSGVEVMFCGHPARMAAGPAALALAERRPLYPISLHYERTESGWGIVAAFHDKVEVPTSGTTQEKVAAMTQQCADALGEAVREHTADWHMLQPVFVKDLDQHRLQRAGVT